jgi:hypothetical protein
VGANRFVEGGRGGYNASLQTRLSVAASYHARPRKQPIAAALTKLAFINEGSGRAHKPRVVQRLNDWYTELVACIVSGKGYQKVSVVKVNNIGPFALDNSTNFIPALPVPSSRQGHAEPFADGHPVEFNV